MCSVLNIPSDSLIYDSNYKNRGNCLLINNSKFVNSKHNERIGSEHDVQRIFDCFSNLGFNVKQILDQTRSNILKELKMAAEDPINDKSQCFVCVVMTHGNAEKLLASDDTYEFNQLLDYFNGKRCPSLVGRPKIFINQACRGPKKDDGAMVAHRDDAEQQYYKISMHSDYLIVYSSYIGYTSYRIPVSGSPFISYLTSVLNPCPKDEDLMSLLCRVNRLMSYEYETKKEKNKQTPCIVTTFTRKLYFSELNINI